MIQTYPKWFLFIIALMIAIAYFLSGCATYVHYPNGKKALVVYSNATNVEFTGGGISFRAERLDNSTPTRAAGSVIGTTGTALAPLIAAPIGL